MKINLSKDELWPVPDVDDGSSSISREPNMDLPDEIVKAYLDAYRKFAEAAHNLAEAAADAGDEYWRGQW